MGSSPGRVKPKTKNDICCFSADLAALRSKSNKWLAQNQDKVSEWSNMQGWIQGGGGGAHPARPP